MIIFECKERPSRRTRVAVALGAAVVAAVAHILYDGPPERERVKLQPHTEATLVPSAMNAYTPRTSPSPAATLAQIGIVKPRVPHESKALEFERLAASSDPKQRLRAYEIAERCVLAHVLSQPARTPWMRSTREAIEVHTDSACGDLKPGQWDDAEKRLSLLREASLKGVHGAWMLLTQREGPQGIYRTIPDGQEYVEWESKAYGAALASADPFALAAEARRWYEKDPPKALALTVAYREALTQRQGGTFDPSKDLGVKELAAALALDPQVQAQAIAKGRAFYAAATRSQS